MSQESGSIPAANQSSNAGCDGRAPVTPKSPALSTRPVPNRLAWPQSGWPGSTSLPSPVSHLSRLRCENSSQPVVAGANEHDVTQQRQANDWAGFVPNLREVLKIARQEAECLSQSHGLSRYDALLDHAL